MKLFNPYSKRLGNYPWVDSVAHKLHYRGVDVFERWDRHYIYAVDSIVISERAGYSENTAKELIDIFHDGHPVPAIKYHNKTRPEDALIFGRECLNNEQQ